MITLIPSNYSWEFENPKFSSDAKNNEFKKDSLEKCVESTEIL